MVWNKVAREAMKSILILKLGIPWLPYSVTKMWGCALSLEDGIGQRVPQIAEKP
jgi:hypothetical protein